MMVVPKLTQKVVLKIICFIHIELLQNRNATFCAPPQPKTARRLRGALCGGERRELEGKRGIGEAFLILIQRFPMRIQQKVNTHQPPNMNVCFDMSYDSKALPPKQPQFTSLLKIEDVLQCSSFAPSEKGQARKRRYLKENQYNWNQTENRRYINFLAKHGHLLLLPTEQKKKLRVNVLMSRFVQSRNSTQCHTHHQKMIEKYSSIPAIIAEYSYLLRTPKKGEEQVTQDLNAIQQNCTMVQAEECFGEPPFMKEYMMPLVVFEKEEECFDYIWQL